MGIVTISYARSPSVRPSIRSPDRHYGSLSILNIGLKFGGSTQYRKSDLRLKWPCSSIFFTYHRSLESYIISLDKVCRATLLLYPWRILCVHLEFGGVVHNTVFLYSNILLITSCNMEPVYHTCRLLESSSYCITTLRYTLQICTSFTHACKQSCR